MEYSGPINLAELIDLDSLYADGGCPYTFFAFPKSLLNEHRVPSNKDAQEYIAAIQSAGVPVGIWRSTVVEDIAYAGVTHESIPLLRDTIASLTQFSDSYASDLCERLFRDSGDDGT